MSESHFDIFGDHLTRSAVKNVARQPLQTNFENMGKTVSNNPIKSSEPVKKLGDTKKSFLSNAGKAFQSTPRKALTPGSLNIGSLIYNDLQLNKEDLYNIEELEFTKPTYNYDNYHRDMFDYLPLPDEEHLKELSPPSTPPPAIQPYSMEFDCSYQDEFFDDDFSVGSFADDSDNNLPDLY